MLYKELTEKIIGSAIVIVKIKKFITQGRELINLTERTETTLLKTRLDKMQMAKLFNSQSSVNLQYSVFLW